MIRVFDVDGKGVKGPSTITFQTALPITRTWKMAPLVAHPPNDNQKSKYTAQASNGQDKDSKSAKYVKRQFVVVGCVGDRSFQQCKMVVEVSRQPVKKELVLPRKMY